jgi:hypothetical protein
MSTSIGHYFCEKKFQIVLYLHIFFIQVQSTGIRVYIICRPVDEGMQACKFFMERGHWYVL